LIILQPQYFDPDSHSLFLHSLDAFISFLGQNKHSLDTLLFSFFFFFLILVTLENHFAFIYFESAPITARVEEKIQSWLLYTHKKLTVTSPKECSRLTDIIYTNYKVFNLLYLPFFSSVSARYTHSYFSESRKPYKIPSL
jgi:hypothetical protein